MGKAAMTTHVGLAVKEKAAITQERLKGRRFQRLHRRSEGESVQEIPKGFDHRLDNKKVISSN